MNTKPPEEQHDSAAGPLANGSSVIEEEEKNYVRFIGGIFWPLILIIALLIAGAVTWLIAPPLFTKSSAPAPSSLEDTATASAAAKTTQSKPVAETSSKNKFKPSEDPKPAPPPPNVYWSVLSKQLFELEQERVAILNLLGQKLPPLPSPSEPKSAGNEPQAPETIPLHSQPLDKDAELTWPSPVKTVPTESTIITWTTVGHQLLELEQQREKTFILLSNKLPPQ